MRGHYYPSAFSLQPKHLININIIGKPQECQLQWAELREKWSRRRPRGGKKKSALPLRKRQWKEALWTRKAIQGDVPKARLVLS